MTTCPLDVRLRRDPWPAAWWSLALPLGVAVAWQAWRVKEAARCSRRHAQAVQPFERHPTRPQGRVLLLGDSTGVGVGAGSPHASLPGLLAAEFPQVQIVNRCRNGARVADVLDQLAAAAAPGERFDLVLVLVGGNDALRMTPHRQLRRQARALIAALAGLSWRTVWLGSANIGGSPLLAWPLSSWMGWQTGRTMRLLAEEARSRGVEFVDFFRPRGEDLFARHAGIYFAGDGVHPSAASYRHCFEVLKHRAPLKTLLAGGPHRTAFPPSQEYRHAQCV